MRSLKRFWGEKRFLTLRTMKILLTGGGTGGHLYPIIAIAEQLNEIAKENRLLKPELFYMSTEPYNEGLLFENNILFEKVTAGKIRGSKSFGNILLNFVDLFKIALGSLSALWRIFIIYPDVVFGKGGYTSFPALLAAKNLQITVVIHESDSVRGKVNLWAGKFAKKVAISYPEAVKYFKEEKTAYTGNPIRKEIQNPMTEGSHKLLGLSEGVPTIFITCGSQGSVTINTTVMDALVDLISKYQVVHQTGKANIKVIEETSSVVLSNNPKKDRYKPIGYLNVLQLRAASGVADLVVSRGGSTIFEIAAWGKPSIIIPIPEPTSHDQRSNAYSYARSGAAIVIEEKNLASHVLVSEIERILENSAEKEKMSVAACAFARKDSAKLI